MSREAKLTDLTQVNLTGMMYCLRAQLQKIVDGGSIVNVSSIQGIQGTTSMPPLPMLQARR